MRVAVIEYTFTNGKVMTHERPLEEVSISELTKLQNAIQSPNKSLWKAIYKEVNIIDYKEVE